MKVLNVFIAARFTDPRQPEVAAAIRKAGHKVHDVYHNIRDKPKSFHGFRWSDINRSSAWSDESVNRALKDDRAITQYNENVRGMYGTDICVVISPPGTAGSFMSGFMAGLGKPIIFFTKPGEFPSLTYLHGHGVTSDVVHLVATLNYFAREAADFAGRT